jgi:hypothetical protein
VVISKAAINARFKTLLCFIFTLLILRFNPAL